MDIDDFLAEISEPAIPEKAIILQELVRAWVAERVAPELMPYPEALMENVHDKIRRQVGLSTRCA